MKKWIGLLAFVLLLTYWTLGPKPWQVFAAADAGYTKVGTVSAPTLTFIDSTVDGWGDLPVGSHRSQFRRRISRRPADCRDHDSGHWQPYGDDFLGRIHGWRSAFDLQHLPDYGDRAKPLRVPLA